MPLQSLLKALLTAEKFFRGYKIYHMYTVDAGAARAATVILADAGLACMMENPAFDRFLVTGAPRFNATTGYLEVVPGAAAGVAVSRYEGLGQAAFSAFDDALEKWS